MSRLWLLSVAAYALQLAVLVAAAMAATRLRPLHDARWRFRLWRAVFVVAVTLPVLAIWTGGDSGTLSAGFLFVGGSDDTAGLRSAAGAWPRFLLAAIVAGGVIRLAWLLLGCLAIRTYAARAMPVHNPGRSGPLDVAPSLPAEVRVSTDVRSPATVGYWRPVILIPPELLDMPDEAVHAVLAHEMAHVRRGDWLRMVCEEAWCAVLWFHPLARALVSRVDVAREMLVDRDVLTAGADRRAYVEALLVFASAPAWAGHPAAPFIRPRHLSARIEALTKEAPMSRRLTFVSLAATAAFVFATTAVTVVAVPVPGAALFPSAADRATRQDEDVFRIGSGVTAPSVVHEVKPNYTKAAMEARIQGTVLLSLVVRDDGTVGRVGVVRSLDTEHGLDDAAIDAVRQWRFVAGQRNGKPVAVQVEIEMVFTLR